jgi:type VI secretion system protein ImpJ
MTGASRVAWREGLFLRPQHFQQQDRFFEALLRARAGSLLPHPWGLIELKLSDAAAQLGKFGIERLSAVMPDGTPITIPAGQAPPDPVDIAPDTRDTVVHLTLPAERPGAVEFQSRSETSSARHMVDQEDVFDAFAEGRQPEQLELARPNVRFGLTREQTDGRLTLPLVRIAEVANGRVSFDPNFISPLLDVRASPRLDSMLDDIIGRAGQRVDELALRATESAVGGSETFASFLLLQALNRWSPVLAHLKGLPNLHPERLYETFVGMAGELATLTTTERRPPSFPIYDHLNLQSVFEPVFALLQSELSMLYPESSGQLRLDNVGPGAYTAQINDHSIFQTSSLYLAASARAPLDMMMSRLPSSVKIGSVTRMPEIVRSQLQDGVRISPTPTPPPQIRILPGYVYFELDRGSPDWRSLNKAPALGVHVSGDWPELKLELWWVKRAR